MDLHAGGWRRACVGWPFLPRSTLFNANLKLEVSEFDGDVLANSLVFVSHFLNLNVELILEPGQLLQTHITESKKLNNGNDDKRQK